MYFKLDFFQTQPFRLAFFRLELCALWHTGSRKLKKLEIQYNERQAWNTSSQLVDEIDLKL